MSNSILVLLCLIIVAIWTKDFYIVFLLKNESQKVIVYSYSYYPDTAKIPIVKFTYPTKPNDSVVVWATVKYPPVKTNHNIIVCTEL